MAELSLAVLPLVVSALENYHNIARPIRRFIKFHKKFEEFENEVKIQRTIFRNEFRLLIGHALGRTVSQDMFNDNDHENWSDEVAENQLLGYLGDSVDGVRPTVNALNSLLIKMHEETKRIEKDVKMAAEKEEFSLRTMSKALMKKLKFTFSESRLRRQIVDLERLNQSLQTFVKQAQAEAAFENELFEKRLIKRPANSDLESYRTIQQTSDLLYETLRQSCDRHISHDAFFSLNPSGNPGTDHRVRFHIGFRQPVLEDQGIVGRWLWFSVESSFAANDSSQPSAQKSSLPSQTTSLLRDRDVKRSFFGAAGSAVLCENRIKSAFKRHGDADEDPDLCKKKKTKKTVKIGEGNFQAGWTSISWSMDLPDLLKPPTDLCARLLNRVRDARCSPHESIGCLKKDASCNLLVYPAPQVFTQDFSNLLSVLQTATTKRHLGRLSHFERARWAKLIAIAALRFGNTPWLRRSSWRSKDLILYNCQSRNDEQISKLPDPYIDVSVTKNSSQMDCQTPGIRNPVLFGLTLLLIEIAFETPLAMLEHEVDYRNASSRQEVEFAVAERMIRVIAGEMHKPYRKVVETCLNLALRDSDFGDDDFLHRYHSDVIDELGDLERKFAGLEL